MSLNVTKIILQHPGVENNRKAWENDIQPSLQLLFHWPPPLTGGWGVRQFQQVLSGVASEMRQSPHGELLQCLSALWSFRRAVAVALANDPFPQLGELRCINSSTGVIVVTYGDHM